MVCPTVAEHDKVAKLVFYNAKDAKVDESELNFELLHTSFAHAYGDHTRFLFDGCREGNKLVGAPMIYVRTLQLCGSGM